LTQPRCCGDAGEGYPAELEHHDVLGDREHHVDGLLDQDDRHPLPSELVNDAKDVLEDDRRQACRGLVEQEDTRPAHQRLGDGQHLLLTAAE
jgi:hypothetical protein